MGAILIPFLATNEISLSLLFLPVHCWNFTGQLAFAGVLHTGEAKKLQISGKLSSIFE